jgi:hypothetical protein
MQGKQASSAEGSPPAMSVLTPSVEGFTPLAGVAVASAERFALLTGMTALLLRGVEPLSRA